MLQMIIYYVYNNWKMLNLRYLKLGSYLVTMHWLMHDKIRKLECLQKLARKRTWICIHITLLQTSLFWVMTNNECNIIIHISKSQLYCAIDANTMEENGEKCCWRGIAIQLLFVHIHACSYMVDRLLSCHHQPIHVWFKAWETALW